MEGRASCHCQCHRKYFGFSVDDACQKKFVLSQWTDRPIVYALYSSLLSAYTLAVVVYTGMNNGYGAKIFIWLTYWSYYVMTSAFLVRALTAWLYMHRLKDKDHIQLPRPLLSLQWWLLTVSCSTTPLVSLLYWVLVYKGEDVDFNGINTHGVNLALVLIDLCVSRYPIRIQHFYASACFSFTYALFTLVYWSLGGTNHRGKPYVYGALNYSGNLEKALVLMFTVPLIVAPILHSAIYGLYRVRTFLWAKCCAKTQPPLPETMIGLTTLEGTAV